MKQLESVTESTVSTQRSSSASSSSVLHNTLHHIIESPWGMEWRGGGGGGGVEVPHILKVRKEISI